MIDISKLSNQYQVRLLCDNDADDILEFCLKNTQYYQYCGKQPTIEFIRSDLHVTPPGMEASSKYYVGFYEDALLVAIMDLIDGYPSDDFCYIGFFMMNKQLQGKQVGTGIIQEACQYLKDAGFMSVRLGIDKGNPQSTHFWKKNGFNIIREVIQDEYTIQVAERRL